MAKWKDLFGDEGLQPTITKRRWIKTPKKFWDLAGGGGVPWEGAGRWEDYEEPYYSPHEILDQLRRKFNRLPAQYTTDPKTGKVIASKSMPRMDMPEEMKHAPYHLRSLFGKGKPLSFKWALPKGALTGPKMISRHAPASDPMRQAAYQAGVSGVGTRRSMVNPATFWPGSAFKIPVSTGRLGFPRPEFGGSLDYTSGQYRFAPRREPMGGFMSRYWGRQPLSFGSFDISKKRPPGTKKRRRDWLY